VFSTHELRGTIATLYDVHHRLALSSLVYLVAPRPMERAWGRPDAKPVRELCRRPGWA
jgi:hypothetical protein